MKYTIALHRDESGSWIATVPKVPGCHSYGRSIQQAMRRIREALELFVDDAADAELTEKIELPARVQKLRKTLIVERQRAEFHQRRAATSAKSVVRLLKREYRFSARDVGQIIGISHQRVSQLEKK